MDMGYRVVEKYSMESGSSAQLYVFYIYFISLPIAHETLDYPYCKLSVIFQFKKKFGSVL